MDIKVDTNSLQEKISEILTDYNNLIFKKVNEEGLTAAENILIQAEKDASPSNTGEYKKSWKGKGKKYKLHRYVGNTKMVKGKEGDIPLSNILEYSSNSHYQGLIKQTYNNNIDTMAQAVVDKIREG